MDNTNLTMVVSNQTITTASNTQVNKALKELRKTDRAAALFARKVFGNLTGKTYTTVPETAEELAAEYTGMLGQMEVIKACTVLLGSVSFEEELIIPEIETHAQEDRFEFTQFIQYEDMDAKQLALVLFQAMGTEIETATTSMTTGLKLKLDLLDELKSHLLAKYSTTRPELITNKVANALAVTKMEKGSSLALKEGNLAVYDYLATTKIVDSKNFKFMAEIGADKTKSLDILILQSAFKSYREEVSKGNLPSTNNRLNLAIMRISTGIKPVSSKSLKGLDGLF